MTAPVRYSAVRCGTRRVPTGDGTRDRQSYRIPQYSAVLPPGVCAVLYGRHARVPYMEPLQTWGPKPASARAAHDDELTRTSATLGRARVSLNLEYPGGTLEYPMAPPFHPPLIRFDPCRAASHHPSESRWCAFPASPTGSFADCICSAFERERRLEAVAAGRSSSSGRSAMNGFPRPRRRMCGHGSALGRACS